MGALILLGLTVCANGPALRANFAHPFAVGRAMPLAEGLTAATGFGMLIALCISQSGSLFAADAWHDITFVAAEVRNPHRNLPLALLLGTSTVIGLYLLCNLAYLTSLPLESIQTAPSDRVATAVLQTIFPRLGAKLMAAAIMVSTLGSANGLSLAGARACYAMAKDGLFFPPAARLNRARVPGWGLWIQGLWAVVLVLPRTVDPRTHVYGNLYSNLLDYVISAALFFYILTIWGVFRLRKMRPDASRPYRAWGYPWLPAMYIAGGSVILLTLFAFRAGTTWPGIVIVALGVPVYFLLRGRALPTDRTGGTSQLPDRI
jgi:APA family basic amino acid/polyamine antiporter